MLSSNMNSSEVMVNTFPYRSLWRTHRRASFQWACRWSWGWRWRWRWWCRPGRGWWWSSWWPSASGHSTSRSRSLGTELKLTHFWFFLWLMNPHSVACIWLLYPFIHRSIQNFLLVGFIKSTIGPNMVIIRTLCLSSSSYPSSQIQHWRHTAGHQF